eukprot:TRINITY_DN2311_c0_g1_i1.p1 TRINITY_DN2311_c0_g1~~TRINITY_DN2311_c0_g1_i1.p1  ORF type:complete len:273 (-),score=72.62 TRINITY_DN2311_c0_g1_i1:254-1072(-)
MGKLKKAGQNSKAVEARERKAAAAAEKNAAKNKAKEDAKWADNDPRAAKRQAKKKSQAEKDAEAQERKAAARAQLAAEEAALSKSKAKGKAAKTGPTQYQLAKQRELAAQRRAKEEAAARAADTTPVHEQPLVENRNRELAEVRYSPLSSLSLSLSLSLCLSLSLSLSLCVCVCVCVLTAAILFLSVLLFLQLRAEGHIDASNIDAAVADLSMNEPGVDKHPEKRRKALHRAFEERMIPILRAENPGLRLSQLKEMCFKQWQSSPENPSNQK